MRDSRRGFMKKLASAFGASVTDVPFSAISGDNDRYEEFIMPFTQTDEIGSKKVLTPREGPGPHNVETIESEQQKVLGFSRLRYDRQEDRIEWLAPSDPSGGEEHAWISKDHPRYQSGGSFDERKFRHDFGLVGTDSAPLHRLEDETAEAIWSEVNSHGAVPETTEEIFQNPSKIQKLDRWFNDSIASAIDGEQVLQEVEDTYEGKSPVSTEEAPEEMVFDSYDDIMGWTHQIALPTGRAKRNYSQWGQQRLEEEGEDDSIEGTLQRNLRGALSTETMDFSGSLEMEIYSEVDFSDLETESNHAGNNFYFGDSLSVNVSDSVANITYHEETGEKVNDEAKIETIMNQYIHRDRTPETRDEKALEKLAYAAK